MKPKTWWERWRITAIMVFILLIGVILLLCCRLYALELAEWKFFVDSIAIAIIISGILGLSIDRLFRQQFAEDAFRTSIGYLLPEELRGEMEWIYSSHILCVDHSQTCELRPIDNDTCAIHVKMLRKFRNISSSNESLPLGMSIDEWFHNTGSSKILSCGYTKLGARHEDFEPIRGEYNISIKEQKIPLAPQEEITVWFESEEIKRKNDTQVWAFGCPTLNPTVTVKALEGMSINVGFGYRSPAEQLGVGTYRLRGTLLPGQRIEIRWWKVEDSNKWLSEDSKSGNG